MMIGGKDTVLDLELSTLVQREVLRVIIRHWPQCVSREDNDHIFYFESPEAMNSWDGQGRTEGNADRMVMVIYDMPREVTVVTDGHRTDKILDDLRRAISGS